MLPKAQQINANSCQPSSDNIENDFSNEQRIEFATKESKGSKSDMTK